MTKRQFNREERGVTERNLNTKKKELEHHKEHREMIEETIKFEQVKREYNDKIKPFTRKMEDERYKSQLSEIDSKIDPITELIEVTEKQLKEGVDVK